MRETLAKNGVTPENVEFILSLINDSELDEDFKIIDQNAHQLMLEKGLWEAFAKSCEDLGIVLTRWNEPER